jgi:hypothetical protein
MTTNTHKKVQEFSHYTSGKVVFQLSENSVLSRSTLTSATDLGFIHLLKGALIILERDCDRTIVYEVIVDRRSNLFRVIPHTSDVQTSRTELSFHVRYESPYWVFRSHYES